MKKTITILTIFVSVSQLVSAQNTRKADSLFSASMWKNAIPLYEAALKSTPENSLAWNRLGFCYHNVGDLEKAQTSYTKALEYKPSPPLEASVRSRMARIHAVKQEKDKAFASLEKALVLGYGLAGELENHKEFENLRSDTRFPDVVDRARRNAMPCLANSRAREFDFWIGDWDVYVNGTNTIVGHNLIEMASGGCMILENWTAKGPMPNNGKSMNFINSTTQKWEQLWIGSGGLSVNNPQRFVNGEYKDGAMRFEFEQLSPQGQKQIGRFIFFNQGPDQVRQFNEVSNDNGKTWTTVYDFIYKRRK